MGIHGWRLFNYPGAAQLQRHPARLRLAVHPAAALGQRRPADPAQAAPAVAGQAGSAASGPGSASCSCGGTTWPPSAGASVSLLVLLAFPFSATLISPLLGLVALPYFMAMASDLRYCGYKRIDVARIYGFNLMLLPVNLAGTVSSLVQGITASKAVVRAHAQGAEPDRCAAVLRGRAVPADRAGRVHVLLGLPAPLHREHGLRRAEHRAGRSTRSSRSSAFGTRSWMPGSISSRCSTSRSGRGSGAPSPGQASRPGPPSTGAPCCRLIRPNLASTPARAAASGRKPGYPRRPGRVTGRPRRRRSTPGRCRPSAARRSWTRSGRAGHTRPRCRAQSRAGAERLTALAQAWAARPPAPADDPLTRRDWPSGGSSPAGHPPGGRDQRSDFRPGGHGPAGRGGQGPGGWPA